MAACLIVCVCVCVNVPVPTLYVPNFSMFYDLIAIALRIETTRAIRSQIYRNTYTYREPESWILTRHIGH